MTKPTFSYAALRDPSTPPRCHGDKSQCPARFLCKGCVHTGTCSSKTGGKKALSTGKKRIKKIKV